VKGTERQGILSPYLKAVGYAGSCLYN